MRPVLTTTSHKNALVTTKNHISLGTSPPCYRQPPVFTYSSSRPNSGLSGVNSRRPRSRSVLVGMGSPNVPWRWCACGREGAVAASDYSSVCNGFPRCPVARDRSPHHPRHPRRPTSPGKAKGKPCLGFLLVWVVGGGSCGGC